MSVPENVVGTADLSPTEGTQDVCQAGGETEETYDLQVNLHDARILLFRAVKMLDFYGDRTVADKLYNRDRQRMRGLAGDIRPFLEDTATDWDDIETDEEDTNDADPAVTKVQLVEAEIVQP